MKPEVLKWLTKQTTAVRDSDKERKERIAGLEPGEHRVMLIKDLGAEFFWAGLQWHADDPDLLLCVPANEWPSLSSSVDVDASTEHFPLSLRCGFSVWFPRDALSDAVVVDTLDHVFCDAAVDMIARIVEGHVGPDAPDPELRDLNARLAQAAYDAQMYCERRTP